jgi:hypothetical protein
LNHAGPGPSLDRGRGRGAWRWVSLAIVLMVVVSVIAQRRGRRFREYDGESIRTAREIPSGSTGTPVWTNAPGFEKDAFTFVRIRYSWGGWGRGGGWATDIPDSDLNLSFRLQQMTSMKVDPDGRILNLTDPELVNFPFIYIVEPGGLYLDDDEVLALRKYLLNGGFLMLDDFWGRAEWENCEDEIRKVFPDRPFVELSLDHPMYQCVFSIRDKAQVPAINYVYSGVTWERSDAREVHHRAIFDDQNRMMVLAFHNTDNGDGWEREGENHDYFKNFSEKTAYPLGINALFYVMTH